MFCVGFDGHIRLVIPGGGTSGPDGYPSWTKSRTEVAFAYYQSLGTEEGRNQHKENKAEEVAFLALSAGSLNVSV